MLKNNYRRYLLVECVEAYLDLDEQQQRDYQQLLLTNPYKEIGPMMQTTFEKGIEKGIEKGSRQTVEKQLLSRFGPLPATARQRLEKLSIEKLNELAVALLDPTASLQSLGLLD